MSIIEASGITVKYNSPKFKSHTFKEYVFNRLAGRNSHQVVSALNDVSLKINEGEAVAFVGHNGSGKSTLLKVLAGIIHPTSGCVKTTGRIAPMIELGAGFDHELSGAENIYLSCMLMGLNKKEIEERFELIVRFAELDDFIFAPLKNYSSGMQARLGFACATAVEPDILLVDEVLSVGDANFSRKCLIRINELKAKGTTVVLVSHDENTVRTFCNKAFVFDGGNLLFEGSTHEALALHHEVLDKRYLQSLCLDDRLEAERQAKLKANNFRSKEANHKLPLGRAEIEFLQHGMKTERIDVNYSFLLQVKLGFQNASALSEKVNIGFGLNTLDSRRIMGRNLKEILGSDALPSSATFSSGEQTFQFTFPEGLPFLASQVCQVVIGALDSDDTRSVLEFQPQQVIMHNSYLPNNFSNDLVNCEKWVTAATSLNFY
jgi:ABC-type polysaccharide/polyol phosphate transport system ATPase subunit